MEPEEEEKEGVFKLGDDEELEDLPPEGMEDGYGSDETEERFS